MELSPDAKSDPILAEDIEFFFIEFIILESLFLINMVMSFLTSYFDVDANKMIIDYKKISTRYINNNFLFDCITLFPFAFVVRFKFSRLLILIKCVRLNKLSQFLDMNSIMR
jgi:hypothetical protein